VNTSNRFPFLVRCASVALLVGGAVSGTAAFAEQRTPSTVTVSFAELNLQSPAGIAVLYQRIHSAASQVCSGGWDRNLAVLTYDAACAKKAQAQAIAQVHIEALSAYAQSKLGRPSQIVAMNDPK
jgi:UrcA family protein